VDAGPPLAFDDARAWTFGGGIEGVLHRLRVRAGVRERANHVLTADGSTRSRRPVLTYGASHDRVLAGKRLQLDFDSTSSFDIVLLSVRVLW
jgi:hypothetical protein